VGNYTFKIPAEDRIKVQQGDVIGIYADSAGCVSWSDGGPQTLFRYGHAGHNELKAFGGAVFIGEGVHRTYSISSTGTFTPRNMDIKERASPSPSPLSEISVSPYHSPSASVSGTPVHSTSPVPSSFVAPSPSPVEEERVGSGSHLEFCADGPSFFCANDVNMKMCNVTAEMCELILQAHASPTPSRTEGASPSSSPSLHPVVQESPKPSATPSSSVPVPEYEQAPEEDGSCRYCNGGTDWSMGQCMSGSRQSPVSMSFDDVATDEKMDLYFSTKYNVTRARVAWNDFAFVLKSQGNTFGSINVDGVNYRADMAVIRSPSEHRLQGYRTPMEMQIFHKKENSNPPETLAISILFEESAHEVSALNWMHELPEDKSPFQVVVDLEQFVSDLKPLVFYDGSYTQPPCTEGLTWGVSMGLAKVSHTQLKTLQSFLKGNKAFAGGRGNNRAVQPLNGRPLTLRSNCGMDGKIECGRGGGKGTKSTAAAVPVEQGGAVDEGLFDDGNVKLW